MEISAQSLVKQQIRFSAEILYVAYACPIPGSKAERVKQIINRKSYQLTTCKKRIKIMRK